MLNKISDFLWTLVRPQFWLILNDYQFNQAFDDSLNQLLDIGNKFEVLSEYTAKLGGYELWIKNYPYSCFTTKLEVRLSNGVIITKKVRPSRRTIYRLYKAIIAQEPEIAFNF